ncbi:arginase family protein, partial [Mangrovicoccus algicola]
RRLGPTADWIRGLGPAAAAAGEAAARPVFLGGDHAMAAATLPAMAARAARRRRPLFLLWLDAHPDLHSLDSTTSGNLHGTPVAYAIGESGFAAFPPLPARVDPAHICMMGLRSVDPAEADGITRHGIEAHSMQALRARGLAAVLERFLCRVAAAGGDLHVSFDLDFLDPAHAPAVGTPVPGGAAPGEAAAIAATLAASGLVTSMDLAELNPARDPAGTSAALMAGLAARMLARPAALSRTGS